MRLAGIKIHRVAESRIGITILIWLFCVFASSFAAIITETEPNNLLAEGNPAACGDTVLCGVLSSDMDVDCYRVFMYAQDSVIATTFSCEGSATNTILTLHRMDTLLAVNDDGGPSAFSRIRYRIPDTGDYVLRVMKHPHTPDSAYSLDIGCPVYVPEDYDFCETPRIIPAFPYYDEGNTRGMTSQCTTPAPDVFYWFNLPIQTTVHITVCTDQFDARVQIVGRCYGDYGDDEWLGCSLGAELYSFFLPEGDHYICVEGTSLLQAGAFSIEVEAVLGDCPPPAPVVLTTVGDYPLLDWPEIPGASYYVIWQSLAADGQFEHLGTSPYTYFIDSTGFAGPRKFYYVSTVCPW